jgi:hypothetical protein
MTRQTIQILSDPASGGISATVDSYEAEELLALLGGSEGQFELGLAPEDDDDVEGHLFGAGAIVRLIVRRPDGDDGEGQALTLHFISAEEASKFKTKVLAGGLLVGTLIAPAAGLTGGTAGAATQVDHSAPQAAATTIVQSHTVSSDKLQIVLPDDGSTVVGSGGGETHKMGSAAGWASRVDESR